MAMLNLTTLALGQAVEGVIPACNTIAENGHEEACASNDIKCSTVTATPLEEQANFSSSAVASGEPAAFASNDEVVKSETFLTELLRILGTHSAALTVKRRSSGYPLDVEALRADSPTPSSDEEDIEEEGSDDAWASVGMDPYLRLARAHSPVVFKADDESIPSLDQVAVADNSALENDEHDSNDKGCEDEDAHGSDEEQEHAEEVTEPGSNLVSNACPSLFEALPDETAAAGTPADHQEDCSKVANPRLTIKLRLRGPAEPVPTVNPGSFPVGPSKRCRKRSADAGSDEENEIPTMGLAGPSSRPAKRRRSSALLAPSASQDDAPDVSLQEIANVVTEKAHTGKPNLVKRAMTRHEAKVAREQTQVPCLGPTEIENIRRRVGDSKPLKTPVEAIGLEEGDTVLHPQYYHRRASDKTIDKCDWKGCGATLQSPEEVDEHLKTHKAGKSCLWKGCKRKTMFSDKDALLRHLRTSHVKATEVVCLWPGCDWSTTSENWSHLRHFKNEHQRGEKDVLAIVLRGDGFVLLETNGPRPKIEPEQSI